MDGQILSDGSFPAPPMAPEQGRRRRGLYHPGASLFPASRLPARRGAPMGQRLLAYGMFLPRVDKLPRIYSVIATSLLLLLLFRVRISLVMKSWIAVALAVP